MKKLFLTIVLFVSIQSQAQVEEAQKCVTDFFVAFHAKDTNALKLLLADDVVMKTIVNKKDSTHYVASETVNDFLNSIASIPDEIQFFEKIESFKVEVDGKLAHVWTPYSFFVNEELVHTGINSFILVNLNGSWKIIHLIDTRIKV